MTGKTDICRHAILFPNVNKLGYSYPIIAVDATTITVKGNACEYLFRFPSDFAVIYGQYIKDYILTDEVNNTYTPVKFFDQMGVNSFADGDTTYNGVCEVCHTKTENPQTHVARYRNTGNQDIDHYPLQNCICCHPHTEGFKGSESKGGTECGCCHSDTWGAMNGTTGYHHYMNNAGASYANILQPVTMGDTSDANRNCLMCHADHDIFRPDINTNGYRAKNLRASISVAPSAGNTSTYSNTDFDNAQAEGGICISCHATEQKKSYTQPDNTGKAPNIEKAKFAQSAHNYTVSSTFTRDSSTFNANCSKCHNDTLNPKSRVDSQSSTNKFGNHQSTLRQLTAPLDITSPKDPLEENLCFRCHSVDTATYITPGGGPSKTSAGRDYYDAADMTTASSEDIFDLMQGTTTTKTLFLRYDDTLADEPSPSAWEMLPSKGDSEWYHGVRTVSIGQVFLYVDSFISPQVASTTSFPAGTWKLHLWAKEDNTDVKASMRATIYVWTADDQKGTVILPPTTYPRVSPSDGSPILKLSTTLQAYDWNVDGASATLNAGDRIVVELWIESNRSISGSGFAYYYWNSSTYNSKVVMPSNVTFMPKGSFMNTLFPSSLIPTGEPTEPAPNDSASTDTFAGGTWSSFEMLDKYDGDSMCYSAIFSQTDGTVFWKIMSFVSQPVPAMTSIQAGTWTLRLHAYKSSSGFNAYMRATIYVWSASDTKGTVILSPTTCPGEISADTGSGVPAYDCDVVGGEAILNPGDKIIIEFEIETGGTVDATYAAYCWGGSYSDSKFSMPKSILFMPKVYGHKVSKYTGLHKPLPAGETRDYMINNRHVECGDCHNPHAAASDLHIPLSGNAVSGPLKSVWGVSPDTNPLWDPVTTFTELKPPASPDGANKEIQICIKCHSYYAFRDADPDKDGISNIIGPSGVNLTDQAMEFSKANKSAHPVKSTLNNMTGNDEPKGLWPSGGNTTMYCTDCHEPHGSITKFSLKGPNRYWPTDSGGSMLQLSSSDDSLRDQGLFCLNCHGITNANIVHQIHGPPSTGIGACVYCHIAVPHGSPNGRLLCVRGSPEPYNYEGVCKIISFRKAADPNSYKWEDCQAPCGHAF